MSLQEQTAEHEDQSESRRCVMQMKLTSMLVIKQERMDDASFTAHH